MKNESGITLIELLIAMSIIGMIAGVLTTFYISGIKVFHKESKNSSLQSENGVILDRIIKDAKEAIRTEENFEIYEGNQTDTLILTVPSKDDEKNFIFDQAGNLRIDHIIYKKTESNFARIIIPDPLSSRKSKTSIISTKVDKFQITYKPGISNVKSLEINLVSKDKFGAEIIKVDNKTKVLLRNN